MKHLHLPASYAALSEEEAHTVIGGGEFHDAWSNFTDHLQFGDFVMGGGLLSFSISFVPMLLFPDHLPAGGVHVRVSEQDPEHHSEHHR